MCPTECSPKMCKCSLSKSFEKQSNLMILPSEHLHILGLPKIIDLLSTKTSEFWPFSAKKRKIHLVLRRSTCSVGHVFGSILKSMPSPTAPDPKGCIQMNFGKIHDISHNTYFLNEIFPFGPLCGRPIKMPRPQSSGFKKPTTRPFK